ncbi:MAG: hypothetical protein H0U18_03370 [Pyrinomonadaceae bacterium]|nr:hypothetical protein [Pyrinomonadaceae bacterium]
MPVFTDADRALLDRLALHFPTADPGAITLFDSGSLPIRIGGYAFGAQITYPGLFETFTEGFSMRSLSGNTVPYLEIRDKLDTKQGVWFTGEGKIGTQLSTLDIGTGEIDNKKATLNKQLTFDKASGVILWDKDFPGEGVKIRPRFPLGGSVS